MDGEVVKDKSGFFGDLKGMMIPEFNVGDFRDGALEVDGLCVLHECVAGELHGECIGGFFMVVYPGELKIAGMVGEGGEGVGCDGPVLPCSRVRLTGRCVPGRVCLPGPNSLFPEDNTAMGTWSRKRVYPSKF